MRHDATGLRSATPDGHVAKLARAPLVSVEWGEFDTLWKWQSYGRKIKKEVVREKEWITMRTHGWHSYPTQAKRSC